MKFSFNGNKRRGVDMSKYWEVGEKNKFGKECYRLHFTQFYDDEIVAGFV